MRDQKAEIQSLEKRVENLLRSIKASPSPPRAALIDEIEALQRQVKRLKQGEENPE